jgi:hypothetical protein
MIHPVIDQADDRPGRIDGEGRAATAVAGRVERGHDALLPDEGAGDFLRPGRESAGRAEPHDLPQKGVGWPTQRGGLAKAYHLTAVADAVGHAGPAAEGTEIDGGALGPEKGVFDQWPFRIAAPRAIYGELAGGSPDRVITVRNFAGRHSSPQPTSRDAIGQRKERATCIDPTYSAP